MTAQRDTILACACDLYLQDGLEGFSMRKLAKAVGVTAPALYRHYDSKERVLMDVIGEAYEHLSRHLYRALQGRTPAERFRMAGDGYLSFALENNRLYEVLFASPDFMGLADVPDDLESQACALGQFWNDRVRECIESGILRPQDPHGVGQTMWAHAHGLIALYLSGMLQLDEADFVKRYRRSVDRILVGLATPAHAEELLEELAEMATPVT